MLGIWLQIMMGTQTQPGGIAKQMIQPTLISQIQKRPNGIQID